MQFIITDEDRKFADLIVERFDPGKVQKRPAGLSDEEWNTYLGPHREDLRHWVQAAQIAAALRSAGLLAHLDETAIGDTAGLLGLDRLTVGAEWHSVYERIKDQLPDPSDPLGDNVDRALEAVREAV